MILPIKTEPVRFAGKTLDANTYVLTHASDALLFDAVDSDGLLAYLQAASIESVTVYLTHEHCDHIMGLARLRETFACKVIASAECSKRMQSPKTNLSQVADAMISMQTHGKIEKQVPPFSSAGADEVFDGDSVFTWQEHSIRCHCLSGHSPGSTGYIMDDTVLFSGDELLPNPVITRFPGGSTERYWTQDMPWLKSIQNSIFQVFPGHGEAGSIQDMIRVNVMPNKFKR